jgi:phosphoribosylpyrophosphate synthetase
MELLIMADALRRSSADRISAVIPYFGYARQDRRAKARTPITAKLVANMITEAGIDRVLTLDLHAAQIQGFFDIPVDNLYASPIFALDIEHHFKDKMADIMVISPDVGGVARARELAKRIDAPLAIVDKRREKAGEEAEMTVIGNVEGKVCIIVDDIADDEEGARADRAAALDLWRADIESLYAGGDPGRAALVAEAVRRFKLDKADFLAVIDGMATDTADFVFCPSFDELDLYCDRVASAVGRLSVKIFGMDEAECLYLSIPPTRRRTHKSPHATNLGGKKRADLLKACVYPPYRDHVRHPRGPRVSA